MALPLHSFFMVGSPQSLLTCLTSGFSVEPGKPTRSGNPRVSSQCQGETIRLMGDFASLSLSLSHTHTHSSIQLILCGPEHGLVIIPINYHRAEHFHTEVQEQVPLILSYPSAVDSGATQLSSSWSSLQHSYLNTSRFLYQGGQVEQLV